MKLTKKAGKRLIIFAIAISYLACAGIIVLGFNFESIIAPAIIKDTLVHGDIIQVDEHYFCFDSIGTINYVSSRGTPSGCYLVVDTEEQAQSVAENLNVYMLDADKNVIEKAAACKVDNHTIRFDYSNKAFDATYICFSDGETDIICKAMDTVLTDY